MIYYLLKFIYFAIRSAIIVGNWIDCTIHCISYPLGVILPFIWNFTWNPKGWVFNIFRFTDELNVFDILLGLTDSNRYEFIYEYYENYFQFLLAILLNPKFCMNRNKAYEIFLEKNKENIKKIEKELVRNNPEQVTG